MTTGEDITAITPLWNPTPPGLPDNSYFTAVNEILGGTVVFNIADGNNYLDKITTTLASGDVPDMFQIPGWEIVNLSDFSEAANELFADLSPFLAGDKAAADYPLLASYPTAAWAMGVFGGKLLGIPWERAPYTNAMFARQDILDELGLEHPTNLEELLAIAEEVNDPSKNRWAFASLDQTVQEAMGVPTLWRKSRTASWSTSSRPRRSPPPSSSPARSSTRAWCTPTTWPTATPTRRRSSAPARRSSTRTASAPGTRCSRPTATSKASISRS